MKKMILFLSCAFLLFGCDKYDANDIITEMDKKIKNSKNYQMNAVLEIYRNEEKFVYDVISTYKEKEFYKVELINKENNHKQIILKNLESVYVLTPSLNKSFKFQSEWPYNNSQIYLIQPIMLDLKNDENRKYEKFDKGYIITSDVNYTSEKDFKKQKVYFDLENNIQKVEVTDSKDNIKMKLDVINLQYNIKLDSDFFSINKYLDNMNYSENTKNDSNTSSDKKSNKTLNDIVYPMYVPTDTYLASQDVINTDSGERVILTFVGDTEFTLIQEKTSDNENVSFVYGDPYLILDTIGTVTDYSVSWISHGVEYSVISDKMSVDELLTVAQSIKVETVGK